MNNLYEFAAYNSQKMYGWGDDAEADAYCDHLNRDREINVYAWRQITDTDEIAKRDRNGEGVLLADELNSIADADAD